jgi:hypothetical protein
VPRPRHAAEQHRAAVGKDDPQWTAHERRRRTGPPRQAAPRSRVEESIRISVGPRRRGHRANGAGA